MLRPLNFQLWRLLLIRHNILFFYYMRPNFRRGSLYFGKLIFFKLYRLRLRVLRLFRRRSYRIRFLPPMFSNMILWRQEPYLFYNIFCEKYIDFSLIFLDLGVGWVGESL